MRAAAKSSSVAQEDRSGFIAGLAAFGTDSRLLETVRQHLGDPDPRASVRLDDRVPRRPAQLAGTLAGIA
jgi:hypothetical protein